MAIAYFIPDQAKLLAGQRSSRGPNNPNARSSGNSQPTSRPQTDATASETDPVHATANRGYGTTINVSVPTLNNSSQEPLGCWEFLTQVFCHALRFYHESSQLQPTVIQISVNFNAQAAPTTTNSADTAATSSQQHTATAEATPATPLSTTTTGQRKQRKFSKRKN